MSAEPATRDSGRRKRILNIAIGYLIASGLAVVFSRPLLMVSAIFYDRYKMPHEMDAWQQFMLHVSRGAYLLLQFASGPIGFLFNLSIFRVAVVLSLILLYGIATALLALCLALTRHRLRAVRISAYSAAAAIWIGCSCFIFWVKVIWGA